MCVITCVCVHIYGRIHLGCAGKMTVEGGYHFFFLVSFWPVPVPFRGLDVFYSFLGIVLVSFWVSFFSHGFFDFSRNGQKSVRLTSRSHHPIQNRETKLMQPTRNSKNIEITKISKLTPK